MTESGARRGAPRRNLGGVLVYEPVEYGHSKDHLVCLGRGLAEPRFAGLRATLVLAPSLVDALEGEVWGEALRGGRRQVVAVTDEELFRCARPNGVLRAIDRWRVLLDYVARFQPRIAHIMMLDELQLPLFARLPTPPNVELTGVLFRPSMHYGSLERTGRTPAEVLRHARKELLHRGMLRHSSLRRVFSLDPLFVDYARRCLSTGRKVASLPDPVFPGVDEAGSRTGPPASGHRDTVPAGRVLFLMFGSLTERKGILPLLGALERLDATTARGAAVLLAGRVPPGLDAAITSGIERVRARRPELWLEVRDGRIPDLELEALVAKADVILAPYQHFIGSSGVLMWAAGTGTPVITQKYGLLGEWCRRHGLGMAIDSTSDRDLADAIAAYVECPSGHHDPDRIRQFVEGRTPEAFAETILAELAGAGAHRGRRVGS